IAYSREDDSNHKIPIDGHNFDLEFGKQILC
ncbi:unnamed protein product, partial [marine sediment metagenome]